MKKRVERLGTKTNAEEVAAESVVELDRRAL
jgi:hypothetical protein